MTRAGVCSIARMRLLFAERFQSAQPRCPTFLNDLPAARQRQGVGRYVFRDHRAGSDIGALADFDRRDQRRVRTDEGILADRRAMLVAAVVIAGDGAGADIGVGADKGVADIAQMIGLGAGFQHRLLDLDKVADARTVAEPGAWPQPRERPDGSTLADM